MGIQEAEKTDHLGDLSIYSCSSKLDAITVKVDALQASIDLMQKKDNS